MATEHGNDKMRIDPNEIGYKAVDPATGEIRYYVDMDKAVTYGGLKIARCRTGNITWAELDGDTVGLILAKRMVMSIGEVYIREDSDGTLTPVIEDAWGYEGDFPVFKNRIILGIKKALG